MYLSTAPAWCLLFTASSIFSPALAREKSPNGQVTIYSWPLSSSSPQELAVISYDSQLGQSSISKYKVPTSSASSSDDDLVRVGLYDPKTSDWSGVVTAASSFNTEYQQKLELYVDDVSQVWHVGFSARPKPKPQVPKAAGKGKTVKGSQAAVEASQVVVEIVRPKLGPTPHLNQPVVLSPEGKLPAKEAEKTFLQKYWWAIALFFVVQLALGGGGGGGGGGGDK